MPTRIEKRTQAFFKAYSDRSNEALKDPLVENIDGVVGSFAPYFVEESPAGVVGGKNGWSFRRAIPKGFAKYRKVGGKRMEVTGVEVTTLDPANVMARVDWEFDYVRPKDSKAGTIAFQNLYFLNFADGDPKIFAYITPDEEAAMKKAGLA